MSTNDKLPEAGRYLRRLHVDKVATPAQKFVWRLEAFGWDWLYWKPLSAMGVEQASNFGADLLARLGPLTSANRTMLRNLRMVFPDWSEAQIAETAEGAWRTFGHVVGEMPHLPKMRPYVENSRIEVVNSQRLDQMRETGKPAVIISGHFSSWEALGSAICNAPLDAQITYRPANNPHIDRRLNDMRNGYGIKVMTPKGAGTRDLVRALTKGQPVGLMNDQKFNEGIAVPFFGYDAMTAPGPTRLAMKFKAPLVPISTVRTGPARYRVTVHDDIWPETGPDEDAAIRATVLKINQFMEARVLEHPDQWFWMHNRWPKEAWRAAGVM